MKIPETIEEALVKYRRNAAFHQVIDRELEHRGVEKNRHSVAGFLYHYAGQTIEINNDGRGSN